MDATSRRRSQSGIRINPFLRYEYYHADCITLINQAIQEQTEIGWMNILRGFLSTKWHTLASTHFADSKDTTTTNRHDGDRRVHKVIRAIYTLRTHALWLGRNDSLHKTADNIVSICHSSLDLEISQLHKEAGLLSAEDRFYCEQSLQRILHSSLSNKRRWLHPVKLSRARKASQEFMQPRMTKFFPVQEPSSTQDYMHLRPIPSPALSPPHTNTTRTLMTQVFSERSPNSPILAPRTTTTQQLLTKFLKERASNTMPISSSPSPLRTAEH
jgi:hypothetical protein